MCRFDDSLPAMFDGLTSCAMGSAVPAGLLLFPSLPKSLNPDENLS
jgi:hypothetical protein